MGPLRRQAVGLVLLVIFTAPQTIGSLCVVRCAPAAPADARPQSLGPHHQHHAGGPAPDNREAPVPAALTAASASPVRGLHVSGVPEHACPEAHGEAIESTEARETVRAVKRLLTGGHHLVPRALAIPALTSGPRSSSGQVGSRPLSPPAPLILRI